MGLHDALRVFYGLLTHVSLSPEDKIVTIQKIDEVLGLQLLENAKKLTRIPDDVLELKNKMDKARSEKDFTNSDKIREDLESRGYVFREGFLIGGIKNLL